MVRKGKLHKNIGRAGVVLALVGVYSTYSPTIFAEEVDEMDVSELVGQNKIELRDQTFTLGRLKIDENTELDYVEELPNGNTNSILSGVFNNQPVENPLPADYEGYVEITGRIKNGDKVWVEITVNGKPAGYISQGQLEVKPITRTEHTKLPDKLNKHQATEQETKLYSNPSFLNTTVEELPKDTEYTILGVYNVIFYHKPVESIQVETEDGRIGWVKRSDVVEQSGEDKEKGLNKTNTSRVNDKKDTDDTEEPTEFQLKTGTVIYTAPTYLEHAEVESTLFHEVEAKQLDEVEDDHVIGTYYKIFTKDGKEGYISVNDYVNAEEREIIESEELDNTHPQYQLTTPKVLTSLPIGVNGARDMGMVDTETVLQATEKVAVDVIDEQELELEEQELEEEEQDEKESDEKDLDEQESDEKDSTNEIYYKLTNPEDESFVGYAPESLLVDVNDEEAKAKLEESKDIDDTKKESKDKEALKQLEEDKSKLMKQTKEDVAKSVEGLQGWSVGESTGVTPNYVAPSSASRQSTVDFIKELAPYAKQVREGGLYPSVMMAQAILESDSGNSGLARNDHNLFGIKGSYNGQSSNYSTQEAGGEGYYSIRAGFRKYPNLKAGIGDYIKLLNNDNYTRNGVVNAPSAFHSLVGLKNAGYATDPLYVPKVWRVIDSYDLTQFD